MRKRKYIALLLSIVVSLGFISCGDDEPEVKEYITVYIGEYSIGGCKNDTPECNEWRAENEKYQTGSGSGSYYDYKSTTWTRYFYDTESAVKNWCDRVSGFTIYRSETYNDRFVVNYDKSHLTGVSYVPVTSK